jgi:hypothetical protein
MSAFAKRMATAMLLGSASLMAQSATVNFTGWAFGNGNIVHVTTPAHNGLAGAFKGSVNFSAAEEAAGFVDILGNGFIAYCVEINEHFNLPSGDMSGYSVVGASSFIRSFDNTLLGEAKANRIGQLMSYVAADPQRVDTAAESTALQLAIWNLVYDSDNQIGAGSFHETGASAFSALANGFLSDSLAVQNRYEVSFLSKRGSQDFLLLRELPEPASLALACTALAAMGSISRRRGRRS